MAVLSLHNGREPVWPWSSTELERKRFRPVPYDGAGEPQVKGTLGSSHSYPIPPATEPSPLLTSWFPPLNAGGGAEKPSSGEECPRRPQGSSPCSVNEGDVGSAGRMAGGGKHRVGQAMMGLPWERQPVRSPAFKAEVCLLQIPGGGGWCVCELGAVLM